MPPIKHPARDYRLTDDPAAPDRLLPSPTPLAALRPATVERARDAVVPGGSDKTIQIHDRSPSSLTRGRICIELGHPQDWVREEVWLERRKQWVLAPVARTAAAEWLALYTEDGALVGAIPRSCPHKGESLLAHADYGSCPGALSCKHGGYSWWLESGELLTTGNTGTAGSIELHTVHIRPDGTACIFVRRLTASAA